MIITEKVIKNLLTLTLVTCVVCTACVRESESPSAITPEIVFESVRITSPDKLTPAVKSAPDSTARHLTTSIPTDNIHITENKNGLTITEFVNTQQPGVSTRGEAIAGFFIPNGKSFSVWAFSYPGGTPPETPQIYRSLDEQEVKVSAGKFVYNPSESWSPDKTDKLRFWAAYPRSTAFDGTDGNLSVNFVKESATEAMSMEYTLSTKPEEHQDVMYAVTDLLRDEKVTLDFKHALTRINFLARMGDEFVEVYTPAKIPAVRVTAMRITNAPVKGKFTLAPNGTGSWKESGSTGTISMTTANVLTGTALSWNGTYSPVFKNIPSSDPAQSHDLMMIPLSKASFDKMTLEIDVEIKEAGGTARTVTHQLPFKDTGEWTMNGWITYLLTITPDRAAMESIVKDWKDEQQHVVFDKQYQLKLSHSRINIDKQGGIPVIDIETNYDGEDGRFQPGIFVDYPGNLPDWVRLTTEADTDTGKEDGMLSRKLRIYVAPNLETSERNTYFTIRAGNLNYKFIIAQTSQYWMTTNFDNPYPANGGMHYFIARGRGFNWKITNVDDPDRILIGPSLLGTTGSANVTEYVKFSLANDYYNKRGKEAYITFSDLSGTCAEVTDTIKVLDLRTLDIQPVDLANIPYVGAFWKWNETGERFLYFSSNMRSLNWTARVVIGSDWIRLDSPDNSPQTDKSGNAESYKVTGSAIQVDGINSANSNEKMVFRVGLTSPNPNGASGSPRYGAIEFRTGNFVNVSKSERQSFIIWVRQGEQPDNVAANTTAKWSPYNVNTSKTQVSSPTLAGGYFTSVTNTCPDGYSVATTTDYNELLLNNQPSAWGYYADGYFDRKSLASNTQNKAYIGKIVYDKENIKSLFLPAAGYGSGTTAVDANVFGYYRAANNQLIKFNSDNSTIISGANGASVRCVKR